VKTLPNDQNLLDKKSLSMQILYRGVSKIPIIPSIRRYNLTISHEQKFVWYRVAKVGTRTILNHLRQSGVCLDVEHASRLHYPVNSFKDYFKFAFVRNPWDRLVSCWRDKVINNNLFNFDSTNLEQMKKFENFVDFASSLDIDRCNRHLRSQSSLIDLNRVDYLGRLETFEDDANHIFDEIGIASQKIVRKNVTCRKKTYQEHYSDQLAEKVAEIYQKDIQIFGYQFETE